MGDILVLVLLINFVVWVRVDQCVVVGVVMIVQCNWLVINCCLCVVFSNGCYIVFVIFDWVVFVGEFQIKILIMFYQYFVFIFLQGIVFVNDFIYWIFFICVQIVVVRMFYSQLVGSVVCFCVSCFFVFCVFCCVIMVFGLWVNVCSCVFLGSFGSVFLVILFSIVIFSECMVFVVVSLVSLLVRCFCWKLSMIFVVMVVKFIRFLVSISGESGLLQCLLK